MPTIKFTDTIKSVSYFQKNKIPLCYKNFGYENFSPFI